jgi:plasmid stabilization system protein ParE
MRRTLRVSPQAEAELQSAAIWYEAKRPGLGTELVAVVYRALETILESHEACPVWRADRPYRTRPLKRFPYVVFFSIEAEAVEVVAVAHAKRRPGYWLEHFHTLAVDGVFVREPDGSLSFVAAKEPTDEEVEALLGLIRGHGCKLVPRGLFFRSQPSRCRVAP